MREGEVKDSGVNLRDMCFGVKCESGVSVMCFLNTPFDSFNMLLVGGACDSVTS